MLFFLGGKSRGSAARRLFDSFEVINLRKKNQISINGKKNFKRNLSCLFGGRRKVKVSKFAFEDFTFVNGSAANSVGTTLEFAAFRSGPDAKYSRAGALLFFLSTTMVFVVENTRLLSRPSCDQ